MSTNDADRADLESKDKDSLIQIATALGGKPNSRAKKAEIIDLILELASEDADNPTGSEGNQKSSGNDEAQSSDSLKQSSGKSRGYSADPMADARAEANGDNGQNGDDEPQEGGGRGRRTGATLPRARAPAERAQTHPAGTSYRVKPRSVVLLHA